MQDKNLCIDHMIDDSCKVCHHFMVIVITLIQMQA